MMRKSWCLAAAVTVSSLLVQAAGAHAHLEMAQPAADSKSAEVREIRLDFSEALEPKLSTIQLEDREDHAVVEPAAQLDPASAKVLVLHLFEPLAPGKYKVTWVVVAADGHRMRGGYSFLVSR
jgi:methionine-rich copper-binding protein CopC